ncbi:MAG: hypothetical protein BAJALOKI3v1_350022 [Promethearchaeota archaeon]|jgi:predicted nucleic acid-binding Zn finger protein|nr:MAG: hypothetical protein BAJALOKI3v1_350022 [Candidatus Lokiarchaeota archaeon]
MSNIFLDELSKKIGNKGVIDKEIIHLIESKLQIKSDLVLGTLERGITKYIYKPSNRVLWIALGIEKEHLIYPKLYCSCRDFYKEVVINRNRKFCKHIVAQAASVSLNEFDYVELEDEEFEMRIKELKSEF